MRSILPLFAFGLAISAPVVAAETVRVPQFRSVDLRGGGSVVLRPGPRQRVTLIEGSSAITRLRVTPRGKLQIEVCDGRCPSRYRLRIAIESPTVPDVAVTGGGSIVAAPGFRAQNTLSAAIGGGGQIDVRSVGVAKVSAAVSGGGLMRVRALESLSGAVTGGGLIRYSGSPRVSSVVNGGGNIIRSE